MTLNILGMKVGYPSSQRLQSALGSTVPALAHVVVGLCSGTPRAPARGKEHWAAFPPSAPAVSHHPCRCCMGNFPLVSRHTYAWARGFPKRPMWSKSGFPRCAGALRGAFFASRRKLINSFANPPFELYRWLMFIEVFYLELISLKSVLMFAKIHTVSVPSCARLLAPFSS